MASGESKSGGFTVTDRRASIGSDDSGSGAPAASQPDLERQDEGETAAGQLPAVDFHTFVLSLGSSALLHLGELEHPDAGGPRQDLPLAKHTIDILEMLEEKTKGNLTAAEEKLISSLLYDLRLRYVDATKDPVKK